MPRIAKLFRNGRSQAVRLPADLRFEGSEVYIRRDEVTGDAVSYTHLSISAFLKFRAARRGSASYGAQPHAARVRSWPGAKLTIARALPIEEVTEEQDLRSETRQFSPEVPVPSLPTLPFGFPVPRDGRPTLA